MIYFRDLAHMIRKGEPRPAKTYRGRRRNDGRTGARAHALKQKRIMQGISRSELDRKRWEERKPSEPKPEITYFKSGRSLAGERLHQIRCRNGVGRPPRRNHVT